MENINKYTAVTESDSDDEISKSDYVEAIKKSDGKKLKINKRKSGAKSVSPFKKLKTNKDTSYLEKISAIIVNEDVSNEDINTMTVKQKNYNYTIKYPTNNGEDYWVLQHYKMNDLINVPTEERWKHSTSSIRIHTSKQKRDDIDIINGLNELIETISKRFLEDDKKQITKRKNN